MPTWATILISITGFVSTCFGLILTYRSVKSTSPSEALKKWQKETDEKLDSDNHRIKRLEKKDEEKEELDKLILRSFKAMLEHFAEGNHTDVMKGIAKNIDEYLIDR